MGCDKLNVNDGDPSSNGTGQVVKRVCLSVVAVAQELRSVSTYQKVGGLEHVIG